MHCQEQTRHPRTIRRSIGGIDGAGLLLAGGAQTIGSNAQTMPLDHNHKREAMENLDCLDLSDLQTYCQNTDNPAPLREYAAIKARAMQARLGGRIQQALQWEKALDGLYSLLPETLQW